MNDDEKRESPRPRLVPVERRPPRLAEGMRIEILGLVYKVTRVRNDGRAVLKEMGKKG
jgi:hypothetical protein